MLIHKRLHQLQSPRPLHINSTRFCVQNIVRLHTVVHWKVRLLCMQLGFETVTWILFLKCHKYNVIILILHNLFTVTTTVTTTISVYCNNVVLINQV